MSCAPMLFYLIIMMLVTKSRAASKWILLARQWERTWLCICSLLKFISEVEKQSFMLFMALRIETCLSVKRSIWKALLIMKMFSIDGWIVCLRVCHYAKDGILWSKQSNYHYKPLKIIFCLYIFYKSLLFIYIFLWYKKKGLVVFVKKIK